MFEVRIERDSRNDYTGDRLTTMVLTYPRFIHAQFMTHRVFSRNAQSSRAVPIQAMIKRVLERPVLPTGWPANERGMVARAQIHPDQVDAAEGAWEAAAYEACRYAQILADLGVHKQVVNRLLEPFSTITTIVSGTEWDNFFRLRCEEDAQPEMQKLALMMREAYRASEPTVFNGSRLYNYDPPGGGRGGRRVTPDTLAWHLPFVYPDRDERLFTKYGLQDLCMISAARCARVSYLGHDGSNDPEKDIALANRLYADGHWSPFEHVATPIVPIPVDGCPGTVRFLHINECGNFLGWAQLRKFLEKSEISA